MRKSKCTESQIAFALKQAETGVPVSEVTRKMGAGLNGYRTNIGSGARSGYRASE